jgi:hypothetical protein
MATTTPNFGWPVPTSTDLVKDGATAIESLGDSIDASLLDLKGGTTGQVLKKNTNTDMDFVWSADSAGMTNPMTTTGDTIYSSSGSTPARLGIGSTNQVLTVSGGLPVWATPAAGAYTSLATGSLSGSAVTISSIAGTYQDLVLVLSNAYMSASTGISYNVNGTTGIYATGLGAGGYSPLAVDSARFYSNADFNSSAQTSSEITTFQNYASSTWKTAKLQTFTKSTATEYAVFDKFAGIRLASAITSITITAQSGTFSAGTYTLYGVK